ncbi:MAG: hypothetical protein KDA36_01085 [Planctomycetaceae bacterium]|nr:hypothetical protein [Planctomycetaceae bacterium]
MGTSRQITEGQLAEAREALKKHSEVLTSKGVTKENFPRDPKWRKIDAQVRQIYKRVNKIGEIEAIDAELKQRKSETADAE